MAKHIGAYVYRGSYLIGPPVIAVGMKLPFVFIISRQDVCSIVCVRVM